MGLASTLPWSATASGSGSMIGSGALVAAVVALLLVLVVTVTVLAAGAVRRRFGAPPASSPTAAGPAGSLLRPLRGTPQARATRVRERYAARHPALVVGAEARLRELLELRDRGAITKEEYAARRAAVTSALRDGPDRSAP